MEKRYDIAFAGQLVDGFEIAAVRESLGKLFKANSTALDRLFSGQPAVIKRNVDQVTAKKYQQAMKAAGAVALIRSGNSTAANTQAQAPVEDMTLAPAGSELLRQEEREKIVAPAIDTSSFSMESAFAIREEVATQTPPPPDTSHLSMGAVGEDIPTLASQQKPVTPDTSELSLAPGGSDVLEPEYRRKLDASPPETDHIGLEET